MKKYLVISSVVALVFGFILFLAILGLTRPALYSIFDYSTTGGVGDTIGGISAPFIGVFGAIVTFMAFYIQFEANKTHNLQFDMQNSEKRIERVDQKAQYLIHQNRDIAKSIEIGSDLKGDKVFKKMFDEYRLAYEITSSFISRELAEELDAADGKLDKNSISNIAFLIFYNGVGPVSDMINREVLGWGTLTNKILTVFSEVRRAYTHNLDEGHLDDAHSYVMKAFKIQYDAGFLDKLGYKPFDGHNTRLGQYFRNLFHLLVYIDNIDQSVLTDDDKYLLAKSLRSQLSSYEQILVYFNSLSVYGQPLRDLNLINKYQLIKNIPLPLITGLSKSIHKNYPNIQFEWDEIMDRVPTRVGS